MSKLIILPCPFCGSVCEIKENEFGRDILYNVECDNGHKLDWMSDTKEEAIEMWNTRLKGE